MVAECECENCVQKIVRARDETDEVEMLDGLSGEMREGTLENVMCI